MDSVITEVDNLTVMYFTFQTYFYFSLIFKPFRRDRGSLKSENPSVSNQYIFGRRQSPQVPGPPKTMPPFPPFPTDDDNVYEDMYMYEYCDTGNLRGKDNPMKVTPE
jgi:hypothetical protein